MDAARVFDKYLTAKIRAERINLLMSKHRHLPLNSRLPAGGKLTFDNFVKSTWKTDCDCQLIPVSRTFAEPEKLHSLKYKLPVLVVPNRQRVERNSSQAAGPFVRFSESTLKASAKKQEEASSGEAKKLEEPVPEEEEPSLTFTTGPQDGSKIEPCTASNLENPEAEKSEANEGIPQLSLQLTTLMQTLENQMASEILQKMQLNAINDQLKLLSGTVTNLNNKCELLEVEKQKLFNENNCKLCHKPSSLCQFCKHKNLPILDSLHSEIFRLMGKRLFTDVALTILLRADNVYHVNVRDLETDTVLGCLLANEAAVREANSMGLFHEILTFCVIDVRSKKKRESIFGGIKFELVSNPRLKGGNSLPNRKRILKKLKRKRKISLQKSKSELLTAKQSVSKTLLQIGKISSNLVMSDDESVYPVRSIQIESLADSSIEDNEAVDQVPRAD